MNPVSFSEWVGEKKKNDSLSPFSELHWMMSTLALWCSNRLIHVRSSRFAFQRLTLVSSDFHFELWWICCWIYILSFFPPPAKVGLNERAVIFEALVFSFSFSFWQSNYAAWFFLHTASDFSNQHISHENDGNHSLSYALNHEKKRHKWDELVKPGRLIHITQPE